MTNLDERFQAALRRAGQIHAERATAAERADEPESVDPVGSPGELEGEATDAGGRSETDNPLEATGE
jgi:hypothetical protein